MQKLGYDFYSGNNVVKIAKKLIGKLLVTTFDDRLTVGRIIETEAYAGITDRASHAYGGRRTARTEVMFGEPGTAYVYLCYGIHHLFNIVTNKIDIPHAILVRSIEPVEGIAHMLKRTGKKQGDYSLGRGPGNVSRALGIRTQNSGLSLLENKIYIAEDEELVKRSEIIAGARIGVDYAGEDALLPYRFYVRNHPGVSAGAANKSKKMIA